MSINSEVRQDFSALEGENAPPYINEKVEEPNLTPKTSGVKDSKLMISHAKHYLKALEVSFGYTGDRKKFINELVSHWRVLGLYSIEKSLKYCNAALFSLCVDQDLPKCPDPSIRNPYGYFPGPIRAFIKPVVRSTQLRVRSKSEHRRRMGLSRAQDLLFLKKGSPTSSEELVADSQRSHKVALTENRTGFRSTSVKRDHEAVQALESEIKNIVQDVFGHKNFRFSKVAKLPSLNSCTTGQIGRSSAKSASMARQLFRKFEVVENVLVMSYHPRTGVLERYVPTFVPAFPLKDEILAKPAFILEPLKVRPIMMGPAEEYFWLLQTQSYLWNSLSRFDTFSLIKNPVTSELLRKGFLAKVSAMESQFPDLVGDWKFHSGDYASATDNFKMFWSKYIWDLICSFGQIPNWLRRIGVKCLVAHKIVYSEPGGVDVRDQVNGQSMGSPISFPVLCILNAALCSMSFKQAMYPDHSQNVEGKNWADIEEEEEAINSPLSQRLMKIRWSKVPMLINGDDCLNAFTLRAKRRWEYLADFSGLTPSVGKTYYSDKFLQINSQCWMPSRLAGVYDLEIVPYLNYALLSSRSARGSEPREWWDLPAMLKEWYKCCEGSGRLDRVQALETFIHYHMRRLEQVPRNMSWFLPSDLGGLGLEPDGKSEVNVDFRQRQVATMLLNHPERRVQLSGLRLDVCRFATDVSAKLRSEWAGDECLDLKEADQASGNWFEEIEKKNLVKANMSFALWDHYLEREDDYHWRDFSKPVFTDEDRKKKVLLYTQKLYKRLFKLQQEASDLGSAPIEVLLNHKVTTWEINDSVLSTLAAFTPRFVPQFSPQCVRELDFELSAEEHVSRRGRLRLSTIRNRFPGLLN